MSGRRKPAKPMASRIRATAPIAPSPHQSGSSLVSLGTCQNGLIAKIQSQSLNVGPRIVSAKLATTPAQAAMLAYRQ